MINSLQSLRGIFAILIFLSHYAIGPDGHRVFYAGGTMGVEFFIVLSGFVMCAGYEKKVDSHSISYRDFMTRRLIRIYPLHLFCLATWMLCTSTFKPLHADIVVPNLLLLQSWFPDHKVFYGCNTPSWSLSVFLFLYAVFPLLSRFYASSKSLFTRIFTLWWIAFFIFIIVLPDDLDGDYTLWFTRIAPPVRLLDFVIGIMLWHLYVRLRDASFARRLQSMSPLVKTLLEILPLVLYVVASFAFEGLTNKWRSTALWWLPTISCVMVYALMDRKGGALSWLFGRRWLVAFGNASFCFYLMHVPVISVVARGIRHFGYDPDAWTLFWISLVVAIVASLVVSRWIDDPVGRCLRRRLIKH